VVNYKRLTAEGDFGCIHLRVFHLERIMSPYLAAMVHSEIKEMIASRFHVASSIMAMLP
jgi:hypothetical protein